MSEKTRKPSLADVVNQLRNKDKSTTNQQQGESREDANELPSPLPIGALERPVHLTQASYNWFPTDGASSSNHVHPFTKDHVKMAPVFVEEDEDEKQNGTGFRGPFTSEDGERGSKLLSEENNILKSSSRVMSTLGEEEEPSTSSPSSHKGKGRASEDNQASGTTGEWVDEINDDVPNENNKNNNNLNIPSQSPTRPGQRFRSQSLAPLSKGMGWGATFGRKQSGIATPEDGDEVSSLKDGKSKSLRSRPHPVKRATTQGWGAIRNKLRGSVAQSTDPRDITKMLTGHELITVSFNSSLFSRILLFIHLSSELFHIYLRTGLFSSSIFRS